MINYDQYYIDRFAQNFVISFTNMHVFCLKGQLFRRNQPKTCRPVPCGPTAPRAQVDLWSASVQMIFIEIHHENEKNDVLNRSQQVLLLYFDANYACGARSTGVSTSKSTNSSKTRHSMAGLKIQKYLLGPIQNRHFFSSFYMTNFNKNLPYACGGLRQWSATPVEQTLVERCAHWHTSFLLISQNWEVYQALNMHIRVRREDGKVKK